MTKTTRGVYKMRTIARLTGFSPALLRAWESRHGLLEPARAPKGHRLYTEDDLAVLRRVRQLIEEGRSIGEIALAGRRSLLEQAPRSAPVAPPPVAPVAVPAEGRLAAIRAALVRGACEIDAPAIERALDEAFAGLSPEVAIHGVLEPAAHEIGERWAQGECSVAGEHLESALAARRIERLLEAAAAGDGVPVLCACWPGELHAIGALVVAFHAARVGARVVYLGPALPFEDLDRACRKLGPRKVYLSVTRDETVKQHLEDFEKLVARHPEVRFVVGGQGVNGTAPALEDAGAVVAHPVTDGAAIDGDRGAELRALVGRIATVPRNARRKKS